MIRRVLVYRTSKNFTVKLSGFSKLHPTRAVETVVDGHNDYLCESDKKFCSDLCCSLWTMFRKKATGSVVFGCYFAETTLFKQ